MTTINIDNAKNNMKSIGAKLTLNHLLTTTSCLSLRPLSPPPLAIFGIFKCTWGWGRALFPCYRKGTWSVGWQRSVTTSKTFLSSKSRASVGLDWWSDGSPSFPELLPLTCTATSAQMPLADPRQSKSPLTQLWTLQFKGRENLPEKRELAASRRGVTGKGEERK